MNFILCIVIVIYFFFFQVKCRSLQVDNDVLSGLEITDDVKHDRENGGRFSWKKLKPILRREVQRARNVIGMEVNMLNQGPSEPAHFIHSKKDENLSSQNLGIDQNEEISLQSEAKMATTTSMESAKKYQIGKPIFDSDIPGKNAADIIQVESFKIGPPLSTYEFPDNISDILNQSGDSIIFQALNDNSSKSFEFDETTLLSEGTKVASLQEVSTIGSELLIDSETNQNLILAELINLQLNLNDDDDSIFTDDPRENDSSTFTSISNNESERQETSQEDCIFTVDPRENDSRTITSILNNESELQETRHDNVFFTEDPRENGSSTIASTSNNESELQETTSQETSNPDITESNTDDRIINENTEIDVADASKDDATELSNAAPNVPKCPDPGWCVFWFLAQEDTCAKDSHCHGSLICCQRGCTKECVDAVS